MLHYLAYGSNLHPLRLRERVPSATPKGVVRLPGYRLAFHKRSIDGSGKCDAVSTDHVADTIHVAVFEIDPAHKPLLDDAEGPGYFLENVTVTISGEPVNGFWYRAKPEFVIPALQPYCWYHALVLAGAAYYGFPDAYLEQIRRMEFKEDPEPARRSDHRQLLKEMASLPTPQPLNPEP